jgi:hypothetical protein
MQGKETRCQSTNQLFSFSRIFALAPRIRLYLDVAGTWTSGDRSCRSLRFPSATELLAKAFDKYGSSRSDVATTWKRITKCEYDFTRENEPNTTHIRVETLTLRCKAVIGSLGNYGHITARCRQNYFVGGETITRVDRMNRTSDRRTRTHESDASGYFVNWPSRECQRPVPRAVQNSVHAGPGTFEPWKGVEARGRSKARLASTQPMSTKQ